MAGTGGLGLPDRDYYLQPSFAAKKAKYQAYVAADADAGRLGRSRRENAKAIVDFETKLAEASWTRAERRDRDKTYNPMTPGRAAGRRARLRLERATWPAASCRRVNRIVVTTNTAFPKFGQDLRRHAAGDPEGLAGLPRGRRRRALSVQALRRRAASSSAPRRWPASRSSGRAGSGRWRSSTAAIGEAVGQVYVARYFPPEAKAKMDALVGDIRTALQARIEKLDWMSPETKAKALEKLAKFTVKIGYPTKWRDYSKLAVSKPTTSTATSPRSSAYEWRRDVTRLNEPVDKAEWGMTPQTVNAYYNPAEQRDRLPGRRSCSRRSSIPTPTRRSTTAASAG